MDNDDEIYYEEELDVSFVSEKANASLFLYLSADSLDELTKGKKPSEIGDMDLYIDESFWEQYWDFEPGAEKAKDLTNTNPNLTFKQALYEVFGHFIISYEIDGKIEKHDSNVFIDETMYSLLEYLE